MVVCLLFFVLLLLLLFSSGVLEVIVTTGVVLLFLFRVSGGFGLFLVEWGGRGRLGRFTVVGLDAIFLMARFIASWGIVIAGRLLAFRIIGYIWAKYSGSFCESCAAVSVQSLIMFGLYSFSGCLEVPGRGYVSRVGCMLDATAPEYETLVVVVELLLLLVGFGQSLCVLSFWSFCACFL